MTAGTATVAADRREMTLARIYALGFGAVYVLVGLLGFVGAFKTGDEPEKLLGIFAVNAQHNVVHLLVGVLGIAAAARHDSARLYAQAIGIVYTLLFVLGIVIGEDKFLSIWFNWPDHILHLLSGIASLLVGFTDLGNRVFGQRRAATT